MEFFEQFKQQINKIWEPVLCPTRTPISNDELGAEFVSINSDCIFKRHDQQISTFDGEFLNFTIYLKINEHLRSIISLRSSGKPDIDSFCGRSTNGIPSENGRLLVTRLDRDGRRFKRCLMQRKWAAFRHGPLGGQVYAVLPLARVESGGRSFLVEVCK